ncbi:hypothetical protein EYZ11_007578 [Aspergillus tanneri]|uniref:Uncharacterized protein n=1 Tax=Aspergillus tanneri TaxID=1220188 RepID=A0A4S3JD07_9EURO|nr:hypothetical protein EYZ11_007578 [Aspergillus tanneri]
MADEGVFSKESIPDSIVLQLKQDVKEFDLDEYLPSETLQWCRTQLLGMGFDPEKPPPIPPAESMTPFLLLPTIPSVIRATYRSL